MLQKTAGTWAVVKNINPVIGVAYRFGYYASSINYDGSVIVVSGVDSGGTVAVINRVGDVYSVIHLITNQDIAGGISFGKTVNVSDDGLRLQITDHGRQSEYIYRRSSSTQAFSGFQEIPWADIYFGAASGRSGLSPSGLIFVHAHMNRDIGATQMAGSAIIWKTLKE